MRIAFVGKGGAGKSTIAATLARVLARGGRDVLAVDSDAMPGLCFGLGLAGTPHAIPPDAVIEKAEGEDGPRFRLPPGLDAMTALDRYAVRGADGVRLLAFEKSTGEWGPMARSQHAWSQILAELPADVPFDIVGDLPGGTRQPMSGWAKYARSVVVVVEPTSASMAIARRLATLRTSRWAHDDLVAVANRTRADGDADTIAARTGLTVIGAIPFDPAVSAADRLGVAPLDADPESPFVRAVSDLAVAVIGRTASPSAHQPALIEESVA